MLRVHSSQVLFQIFTILTSVAISTATIHIEAADALTTSTKTDDLQADQPLTEVKQHAVRFDYRITADRRGHLTCDIDLDENTKKRLGESTTAKISNVYLLCPQVNTSICYFNCNPSCTFVADKCQVPEAVTNVIGQCNYQLSGSSSLTVQYTVNMEALDRSGNWSCEYKGIRARSIYLQAAEPKSTTSTAIPRSMATRWGRFQEYSAPTVRQWRPTPIADFNSLVNTKSITQNSLLQQEGPDKDKRSEIFKALSKLRPEIILTLIILFVLAIIVNIGLALRCALTKSYVDSVKDGHPNKNLGRCLCFESSSSKINHSVEQPFCSRNAIPIQQSHTFYPQGSIPTFLTYSDQQSDCSVYNVPQRIGTENYTTSRKIPIPTTVSTISFDGQSVRNGAQLNQTAVYQLIPAAEGYNTQQVETHGYTNNFSSTISTTIYDDLSASSYHDVTPMLVRLPAGETGIIICQRPDPTIEYPSILEKKTEFDDGGPLSNRRLPSTPQVLHKLKDEKNDESMEKRLQNTVEPYVLLTST